MLSGYYTAGLATYLLHFDFVVAGKFPPPEIARPEDQMKGTSQYFLICRMPEYYQSV